MRIVELIAAGSQPCHAFAEPGGHRRTPEERKPREPTPCRRSAEWQGAGLGIGAYCRGRCSNGPKQRPESCRRVRPHPRRDVAVSIERGLDVIVAEALA